MTWWTRGRGLGLTSLWVATVVALVVAEVIEPGPVRVIGRDHVFAPLWPMVGWIPSVGIGGVLPLRPVWARSSERAVDAHIVGHAVSLLVLVAALLLAAPDAHRGQMFRAVAIFSSVALISAAATDDQSGCWAPGLCLGLVMWMMGTTTGGVEPWAIIFRADIGLLGTVLSAIALIAAEAAVLVRLDRGTPRSVRTPE